MADPPAAPDQPRRYAVRRTSGALRDVAEIAAWIMENVATDADGEPISEGARIAQEWQAGLLSLLSTLAEEPARNPVLPVESRRLGVEVRRILYRRTPSSRMEHHVYYLLQDGDDGSIVFVFHVRGASRRTITAKEARALREELN